MITKSNMCKSTSFPFIQPRHLPARFAILVSKCKLNCSLPSFAPFIAMTPRPPPTKRPLKKCKPETLTLKTFHNLYDICNDTLGRNWKKKLRGSSSMRCESIAHGFPCRAIVLTFLQWPEMNAGYWDAP